MVVRVAVRVIVVESEAWGGKRGEMGCQVYWFVDVVGYLCFRVGMGGSIMFTGSLLVFTGCRLAWL